MREKATRELLPGPFANPLVLRARTLVNASTRDFTLDKYADLYTNKLQQLIEAKVAGKEIVAAPATEGPQVINLMEALKQSVARVQGTNGAKPRKTTRRLVRKIS